jgi:AcrR family transcriptional regulator
MPKRIPHLSEIILTDAADLFLRLGYDAVDMKQVAAEAGTSVGNLYNYFPSKPALFLAIRDRWKKELVETCRDVLASDRPRRERILAVLGRFYDDVSKWHGIWHEFMAGQDNVPNGSEFRPKRGGIPHWEMSPEEQELTAKLDSLLLDRPAAAPPYRSAFLCITATLQLAVRYPQYREDNWKFIETLVDKL